MCGRFTLATPAEEWAKLFRLEQVPDVPPRFNIAPTQEVAVVRIPGIPAGEEPAPGAPPREAALVRWGLIPHWAREPGRGSPLINARAETVAERPSFRDAFRRRRCLVVADGFYEWQQAGSRKQPYWIGRPDRRPFALAGLWDRWRPPEGDPVESCAILTTEAEGPLRELHDRMPLILEPESWDRWLDPEAIRWEVDELLRPYPPERLTFHPVSTRVNRVENDDPDCIAPLRTQTELFDAEEAR